MSISKVLSEWLSQLVTRSPIELFWTAKNHKFEIWHKNQLLVLVAGLLSCNLVSSNKCDLVSSNTQTQLTMSLNTCRALSTFTITIRVNSEWFSKNLRFLGGCVDQGKLFFCCCKTLPSSLPIFDRSICISICGNCQRGSLTSLFLKYFFETSSGW